MVNEEPGPCSSCGEDLDIHTMGQLRTCMERSKVETDPRKQLTTDKPKDPDETWIFTFGYDHTHPETGAPLKSHYVEVPGDFDEAREKVVDAFGENWSFQYRNVEQATGFGKHELTRLEWSW